MRSFLLVGGAAAALACGVIGAGAQPLVDRGWPSTRYHHKHSYVAIAPLQTGRAAYGYAPLAGDDGPRGGAYHDPNFSSQQDDAYAGRFP
jgi:hypothetical protein